MKTAAALALAALAGVAVVACLPPESRDRMKARARHRMREGLENIMAGLPENAPPKLVMSILPRLQAQNDQIIALLQEQNKLLHQRRRNTTQKKTAG